MVETQTSPHIREAAPAQPALPEPFTVLGETPGHFVLYPDSAPGEARILPPADRYVRAVGLEYLVDGPDVRFEQVGLTDFSDDLNRKHQALELLAEGGPTHRRSLEATGLLVDETFREQVLKRFAKSFLGPDGGLLGARAAYLSGMDGNALESGLILPHFLRHEVRGRIADITEELPRTIRQRDLRQEINKISDHKRRLPEVIDLTSKMMVAERLPEVLRDNLATLPGRAERRRRASKQRVAVAGLASLAAA